MLEAAGLLLDAATCTSYPRLSVQQEGQEAWDEELKRGVDCRQEMKDIGVSDENMKWLARLVSTRRIVIVPTANALGYFQKRREENGIDPNRDFPYDLRDPRKCMQTIAGRTLNEVFREHMFQLSLTFHGGMEVIGYEWGAPTYGGKESPDDVAQNRIAAAYSQFAGGWTGTKSYEFGPMNDLVYPVRGGMEDWAYAGSWDPDRVIQCQPATYGGYPAEKTTYDGSTLRVFNMLVETSNQKIPNQEALGTTEDLMSATTPGNGHISRNIRLALLAAELVEPYISWRTVAGLELTDDIVPLVAEDNDSCKETRALTVKADSDAVTFTWTVGGSLQTDSTQIWYAKWGDAQGLDCSRPPKFEDIESVFTKGTILSSTTGTNRFSKQEMTIFEGSIDPTSFAEGDKIVVLASAVVDQNWSSQTQASKVAPSVVPQSHIVNVRTNSTWHHEKDGKVITGRLNWFSEPLTINLGTEMFDDSNRLRDAQKPSQPSTVDPLPSPTAGGDETDSLEDANHGNILLTAAVIMVIFGVLIGGRSVLRSKLRSNRRDQIRDFIEDPSAESPGLQKGGASYSDIEKDTEIELGEYS